jgi:GNAT superfamily N-acetyltransferase
MPTTDIVRGYTPGSIGRIAEMHGRYYGREWGFPAAEGLWLLDGQRVLGSIALVRPRDGEPARLRWFIVDDAARGSGAGALLMQAAMDFARQAGYRRLYLTTFAGLDAARHLYERHGFVLTAESRDDHWGAAVNEQRFDWHA